MAFGEPIFGSVQRRIMVFVYQSGGEVSLSDLAVHLARPSVDRGRSKRSADWLAPKYLTENNGQYQATAVGMEIAANIFHAAKDKELCQSIQFHAHRASTGQTCTPG